MKLLFEDWMNVMKAFGGNKLSNMALLSIFLGPLFGSQSSLFLDKLFSYRS